MMVAGALVRLLLSYFAETKKKMKSAALISILFILVLVVGAFSCRIGPSLKNPQQTLVEDISVQRTFDGNYSFSLNPEGQWVIYMGQTPETINWDEPLAEVEGDYLTVPAPEAGNRAFFGIISPKDDTVIVSERQIPMAGQVNFRDLGGLPSGESRYVSWGKLYRSGNLAALTERDLRYFEALDIKTVVDLRNNLETEDKPDRLPKGVKYYQYSISDKEGKAYSKLRRMVLREGYRREKAKDLFVDVMATFADSLADDAQPIFDILISEEEATPLLYHCTGGKDRTGFVTALILSALGVERDVIMQDYLMSNFYRRDLNLRNVKKARLIGLDQETLEYALQVRKEYLNAVFDVMDEYGGTDAYLETKYGLTDSLRKELKMRYTEPILGKAEDEGLEEEASTEEATDADTPKKAAPKKE